ncbi:hypothetical protein PPERSA_02569 [Pseudocohnilembus persalinus]|uniref:Uncharacterized protein n=1 Tax=Pseudocohnilembus persalinus TaxID=266149 RepID=A0A0V0R5C6_PSEPJ|nr:hypothetical protein PPERSA_02569 [Pseudocohnilembus persalinus]|eukprot:KRX09697.1 hypothetical protein PPERSA_02569 [Pseudocohnilembus persalinus]
MMQSKQQVKRLQTINSEELNVHCTQQNTTQIKKLNQFKSHSQFDLSGRTGINKNQIKIIDKIEKKQFSINQLQNQQTEFDVDDSQNANKISNIKTKNSWTHLKYLSQSNFEQNCYHMISNNNIDSIQSTQQVQSLNRLNVKDYQQYMKQQQEILQKKSRNPSFLSSQTNFQTPDTQLQKSLSNQISSPKKTNDISCQMEISQEKSTVFYNEQTGLVKSQSFKKQNNDIFLNYIDNRDLQQGSLTKLKIDKQNFIEIINEQKKKIQSNTDKQLKQQIDLKLQQLEEFKQKRINSNKIYQDQYKQTKGFNMVHLYDEYDNKTCKKINYKDNNNFEQDESQEKYNYLQEQQQFKEENIKGNQNWNIQNQIKKKKKLVQQQSWKTEEKEEIQYFLSDIESSPKTIVSEEEEKRKNERYFPTYKQNKPKKRKNCEKFKTGDVILINKMINDDNQHEQLIIGEINQEIKNLKSSKINKKQFNFNKNTNNFLINQKDFKQKSMGNIFSEDSASFLKAQKYDDFYKKMHLNFKKPNQKQETKTLYDQQTTENKLRILTNNPVLRQIKWEFMQENNKRMPKILNDVNPLQITKDIQYEKQLEQKLMEYQIQMQKTLQEQEELLKSQLGLEH